jgi:hypothetical protein
MTVKQAIGVLLIVLAGLNSSGWIPSFDGLPVPPFGQRVELFDAWFIVIEESAERPAYLLVNGDGAVISEGPLPETREAVLAIVGRR